MNTQRDLHVVVDPEWRRSAGYEDYAATANRLGLAALNRGTAFVGSVHEPELQAHQLANAAMVQLFDASALAPGDMKDKVLAFQQEVKTFLVHYMKEAMRSEGRRIGLMLEAHGFSNAASLVKSTQI